VPTELLQQALDGSSELVGLFSVIQTASLLFQVAIFVPKAYE